MCIYITIVLVSTNDSLASIACSLVFSYDVLLQF